MKGASDVLAFLDDRAAAGERTALVTITHVEGSSSRAIGTHIGVSAGGSHRGSLSGGCVEAAVVGEAIRVMGRGRAETVRLGAGSPFMDVRLPCGGGIDLLITPDPSRPAIQGALSDLRNRRSTTLVLRETDDASSRPALSDEATGWHGDEFRVRHDPDLRLVVVGHGEETTALARAAACYGASVAVLSPDRERVADLLSMGIEAEALKTPAATPALRADPYTAIVFLFHDHEWETRLIAQALATPAFYVGAMGSRRTHAARLSELRAAGTPESLLGRIVSPLGSIPSSRDPDTLALSALSQIVTRHAPPFAASIRDETAPPSPHGAEPKGGRRRDRRRRTTGAAPRPPADDEHASPRHRTRAD